MENKDTNKKVTISVPEMEKIKYIQFMHIVMDDIRSFSIETFHFVEEGNYLDWCLNFTKFLNEKALIAGINVNRVKDIVDNFRTIGYKTEKEKAFQKDIEEFARVVKEIFEKSFK